MSGTSDAGGSSPGAAAPERRTQAERRAQSDREMMRAATRLIAANGSAGVSLATIGIEAGYSRGLPAERYGSKVRLLEAVIDASDAWFRRRLRPRLQGRHGLAALRERIRAHLETVRDSTMPTVALYQLIVDSTAGTPDLQPRVKALNRSYRESVVGDLEEARERGEVLATLDIEGHALLIVGAMHGIAMQSLIDPARTDVDGSIENLIRTLVDTIDLAREA